MGHIKNILSESIIGNQGLYSDHARLEIHENIHFHYRDGRYVFCKDDFIQLCEMFKEAYENYKNMNMPEHTENMTGLCERDLINNGFHSNRLGCELNEDDTIHIHHRDLRLHFTLSDYRIFVETIHNGYLKLNDLIFEKINIRSDKIRFHPIVTNHIKELIKYNNNEYPKEKAEDVIKYSIMKKHEECTPNNVITRANGFPDIYPGSVTKKLDKKYLFSLYESIKKYGYASDLFYNKYVTLYKEIDKNNKNEIKLYFKDSHRAACLLYLGYDNIKVIITKPESGWIS